MERWTSCDESGRYHLRRILGGKYEPTKKDLIQRVGRYEDTGLEPEDINELLLKAATLETIESMYDGLGHPDHLRGLVQAEKDGQEVYRLALDTWGADAQTLMAFEEMSELQKELCKHARGRDNREKISEEIADVLIMLDQMMILHDCKQAVKEWKQRKLKRLAGRLTREEALKAQKGGDEGDYRRSNSVV